MVPVVDVCISTWKRPEQLEQLLRNLLEQETDGRFTITINVADNDAEGSGLAVVERLRAEGHRIACEIEPVQNISLGRNRSISLGHGEWIATTDDDLRPGRRWLVSLFDAAITHGADVVHGWNEPSFLPGTPEYVREFHRRSNPPTGSTSGYVCNTGNALFRRSLVAGDPSPFDPALGRTGGEDTDFFKRLRSRGCRMVWCREALVHSDIPAHRSTLRWILKRRFRHGTTAATLERPLTPRTFVLSLRSIVTLGGISALYHLLGTVHRPSRRKAIHRSVSMLLYSSYLAGRIARAANFRYEEYGGGRAKRRPRNGREPER